MGKYTDYIMKTAQDLLSVPSPSGFTHMAADFVKKEFEKLLKIVSTGDTLVFDSVSRMSRTAQEGYEMYQKLYNQGVSLVFLKEPHINTSTYQQAMKISCP